MMNEDIHMSSENYEANGYWQDLDKLIISRYNLEFQIILDVGAKRKVSKLGTSTL